jgi:DNA-binding NarL/FixJ family response regulator
MEKMWNSLGGTQTFVGTPSLGVLPNPVVMSSDHTTGIIAVTDAEIRHLIRRFAQQIPNFRVVAEAVDGEQALALLLEHLPDIVVLDVLMPLCSGKQVLDEIRRRNLRTRVLLTTADDSADYFSPAFWNDALGYLYRGDGLEDWIVPALKTVISGRHFVSPTPLAVLRNQHSGSCQQARPVPLTSVDVEILRLTVRGKSDKEMANALDIPVRTVEKRKARLRRKLGVNSTVELAVYAVTQHLFDAG